MSDGGVGFRVLVLGLARVWIQKCYLAGQLTLNPKPLNPKP